MKFVTFSLMLVVCFGLAACDQPGTQKKAAASAPVSVASKGLPDWDTSDRVRTPCERNNSCTSMLQISQELKAMDNKKNVVVNSVESK